MSEAIAAAPSLYRAPVAAEQLLADMGLTEKRRDFIEKLSGGQRRRLDVALASAGDPPLLVLDEPTSGFVCVVRPLRYLPCSRLRACVG